MMNDADDHLKCQACQELFHETSRIPRLLTNCGHTYCEICIQKAIQMRDAMKGKDIQKGKRLSFFRHFKAKRF